MLPMADEEAHRTGREGCGLTVGHNYLMLRITEGDAPTLTDDRLSDEADTR